MKHVKNSRRAKPISKIPNGSLRMTRQCLTNLTNSHKLTCREKKIENMAKNEGDVFLTENKLIKSFPMHSTEPDFQIILENNSFNKSNNTDETEYEEEDSDFNKLYKIGNSGEIKQFDQSNHYQPNDTLKVNT